MDARTERERRLRYRCFVKEGLAREIKSPLERAQQQAVLGSEGFLEQMRQNAPHRGKHHEVTALRRGTSGSDPRAVIEHIAAQSELSSERLFLRTSPWRKKGRLFREENLPGRNSVLNVF